MPLVVIRIFRGEGPGVRGMFSYSLLNGWLDLPLLFVRA